MYKVNVKVETYAEKYCDILHIPARNEQSARDEAERRILTRHGRKQIISMQVTGIKKIS